MFGRALPWSMLVLAGCAVTLERESSSDSSTSAATGSTSASIGSSAASTSTGEGAGSTASGSTGSADGGGGDSTTSASGPGGAGGDGPCGDWGQRCCEGDTCTADRASCDADTGTCLGCVASMVNGSAASTTCVTRKDGAIVCWGDDHKDLLACPSGQINGSPPKVIATYFDDVAPRSFAAHACGIDPSSKVSCWGANASGQVGQSPSASECDPNELDLEDVSQVIATRADPEVAGSGSSIALAGGKVYGWGSNDLGQIAATEGDRDSVAHSVPRQIGPLGERIIAIAAGRSATCALDDQRTVRCVGDNGDLALGAEDPGDSLGTPALSDVRELVGGSGFFCALIQGGQVRCWGENESNQLGEDTGGADQYEPTTLAFDPPAAHVYAGGDFACALLDDDTVSCWGNNTYLQTGTLLDHDEPAPVYADADGNETLKVSALALGDETACAITNDDLPVCWGRNFLGETGQPVPEPVVNVLPPMEVLGVCE